MASFYETITTLGSFIFFALVAFFFIVRRRERDRWLNGFISRKTTGKKSKRAFHVGILSREMVLVKTAGYSITLPEYVVLCFSSMVIGAAIAQFGIRVVPISALISLAFATVPHFFFVKKTKERSEKLFLQMAPMLRNMGNFLRAGRNQLQAIEAVIPSLEFPMKGIMDEAYNRVLARDTVIQALTHVSKHISLNEFEDFVLKFEISAEIGGDLASSLEDLAHLIDTKKDLKNEIKSATMENRMSSYIMALIPIGLFFLFKLISPEYSEQFYKSTVTIIGLVVAFVMIGFGVFLVRKMCKINVDY